MEDYQRGRGKGKDLNLPMVPVDVKVMMTNSLEEIVEFFCRNQVPILPCHGIQPDGACTCKKGSNCPSPGKHPLMFRWQMVATCDKDVVMSWIGSGTKPVNLAIRTGVKNRENGKYLVGTDFDLVDHPMKQRLERYSKTVTQQSGSGGDHAFYWSRLPVRNSVQLVDDKMDIRGSGGIMVIAPSKHKSGNQYKTTCNLQTTQIQDLPDFIEQRLRIAVARKSERELQTLRTPSAPSQVVRFWTDRSIASIKNAMANGEKIPVGARNTTMHRLLSSERARGIPTSAKLMLKATEYLSGFDEPESFLDDLDGIVKSVMRYPAYNNSHEKVNELYLGWLGKNGYKKETDLETLDAMDKKFFESLEPGSSIDDLVSLKEITEQRTRFMKEAGLGKFATYRSQLLAKKLQSLGIQKKRTAKGNHWLVKFKELPLKSSQVPCNNTGMLEPTLAMATEELNDDSRKKDLKDGDVITWKGKKVRVELIKTQVKNTVHPREHLYQDRTGYDYNKALMALMPRLSEEQMDLLLEDQLVMDKEATMAWVAQVRVGDVVGVKCKRYEVIEHHPDYLLVDEVVPVQNKPGTFKTKGEPTDALITGELDHARELELLDILWRDGKPYGIPETRDMTVVLLHDLDEQTSRKKKNKK